MKTAGAERLPKEAKTLKMALLFYGREEKRAATLFFRSAAILN